MSKRTDAPTQKQLRYLRLLAERAGQSFATPQTREQASREIRRLKRQPCSSRAEVEAERRAVARDMAERRGDDARVRVDAETTGYGASATWAKDAGEESGPRVVHCRREPFDVYVGRPSKWGNPFKAGCHGTREQVIAKYERWLQSKPELMVALPELRGKVLACWCAPRPCHADVLLRLANAPRAKTTTPERKPPDRGKPRAFAGYRAGRERRLVVVQRIGGAIRVGDLPADAKGERYLLADGLETCGELDALMVEYARQAAKLGVVPASMEGLSRELERLPC